MRLFIVYSTFKNSFTIFPRFFFTLQDMTVTYQLNIANITIFHYIKLIYIVLFKRTKVNFQLREVTEVSVRWN